MTDPTLAPPAVPSSLRGARRIAIIVTIASLVVTAAIGIIALLSGDFGDTQWRILATTSLVAGSSILLLCHLAVVGRAVRVVGFTGITITAIALALALILIWTPYTGDTDLTGVWRWLGVTWVIAVSLAHANLLLLLSTRRRAPIRWGLWLTLVAITVVAAMIVLPILTDGDVPGEQGETYWRVFGVVAILDVLGTIAIPVLSLFLRDEQPEPQPEPVGMSIELSPELAARLILASGYRRIHPEIYGRQLIEQGLPPIEE
ncbi:hypothetical protein [Diaminobutyricimonas sp. LJ205]|uniref:hypothetical protein n=1 Tax=Diaminobutyricimonas sp. LJ205 TaxID=2683590 RepID=UPI0012F4A32A|nr:hypothetical protein [Diaminobutyricimonas sp. LJ205]